MKTSRYTDEEGTVALWGRVSPDELIIAILRQAEGGMPVVELCREHGMSSATFYKWRAFGVSETCYRYGPKWRAENQEITDLLTGLTDARKT
jgi:hypothetical protein